MTELSSEEDQTTVFVRRAVAGECAAVEWIVSHFQPLVEAQVRVRLRESGGQHDVEDLAADVWLVALRYLGKLLPRDGRLAPVLVRFLGTTVLQVCNNFLRRKIRRTVERGGDSPLTDADPLAKLPDDTLGVVTRAVQREIRSVIGHCLDALSPDKRSVLVLRLMEQRSNQEIASLLGIPANTVAVRYRRALETLRAGMPKELFNEIFLEAG